MALSGSNTNNFSSGFGLLIEWNATQSIASNHSVVTVEVYLVLTNASVGVGARSNGSITIDGVSGTRTYSAVSAPSTGNYKKLLATWSRTVPHNSNGTKTLNVSATYPIQATINGTYFGSVSVSDSKPLNPIPRTSVPTLSYVSRELGQSLTVYTNRADASFTHTLKYTFGNQSDTIATGVQTSQPWTLPLELANAIPKAQSGVGTITCETYSGFTLIGTSSVAFTGVVPVTSAFIPSITTPTVSEGATLPSGITAYVQSHSRLKVQFSGTGKYGATISSYRVSVDDKTYNGNNITSDVIQSSGNMYVYVYLTDSRGFITTTQVQVTIQPYQSPKIEKLTARRGPNDEGTDLIVDLKFAISPISNQNAKRYLLRYRPTGGSWEVAWDSNMWYTRETQHITYDVLDVDLTYDVALTVYDSFTTGGISRTIDVPSGFSLMNFNKSGKGIAFGKVSESDSFAVAMPMTIDGYTPWHAGNDANLFYETDNSISSTASPLSWKDGIRLMRVGVGNLGYPTQGIVQSVKRGTYVSQTFTANNREIYLRSTNPSANEFYDWSRCWTSYNSNTMNGWGSNTNGRYIQFSDGTLVCWHTLDLGTLTIASNQVSPSQVWTFPTTFTGTPVININNQVSNADWMRVSFSTVSTTFVAGIVIFNYFQNPLTQSHKIHLFAIGRWF